MPKGRRFSEFTVEQIQAEHDFARGLLSDAISLLFSDNDVATAKITLRDLVNGTLTFKVLAAETGLPDKSLQRMLGPNGNPSLSNFVAIISALMRHLRVDIEVKSSAVKRRVPRVKRVVTRVRQSAV